MSTPIDAEPIAPPPKENPETLVLRGRPRPAVRFRRGLIVGITAATAAALITVSWLASSRRVSAERQLPPMTTHWRRTALPKPLRMCRAITVRFRASGRRSRAILDDQFSPMSEA